MRELRVLLLTSKRILPPGTTIFGRRPNDPFGDSELEDYIELLSACNIPFDIKYADELLSGDIFVGDDVRYSTIVLSLPAGDQPENAVGIIKTASSEFGVSILASYDRISDRTMELFGITGIKGKKFICPCRIIVDKNHVIDPFIQREISLGNGFRLEFQRWGFRRHPIRYLKKHLKIFLGQVFFYMAVNTTSGARKIAVLKKNLSPAILKYTYGKGVNYYISLQSDTFLDRLNSMHRIIGELIKTNSGHGMVHFDLGNSMALRMDDPGTCERVYLRGFDTRILNRADWKNIVEILRESNAKLSIMYVPLWVDDGRSANGTLYIKGNEVKDRKKGAIYPSKDVVFVRHDSLKYDYVSEFDTLKEYAKTGDIDIESHGLTHLDTNLEKWVDAEDRYSNYEWYHEFRHVVENRESNEEDLARVMRESAKEIVDLFGISPSTVTPSGHEQSRETDKIAHAIGYKLVSSDYHSMERNGVLVRNGKIQSLFLDGNKVKRENLDSGYPIIGVFHDYDIVKLGTGWLERIIKQLRACGINRFMSLRELAGYLCCSLKGYLDKNGLHLEIDISGTGGVVDDKYSRYFSAHEMALGVRLPSSSAPKYVEINGKTWEGFRFDKQRKEIKVSIPPFGSLNRQRVHIGLSEHGSIDGDSGTPNRALAENFV